jgi:ABC-type transport system involved in cytochrome bd biosynthesis fused ATPase/permease subunit
MMPRHAAQSIFDVLLWELREYGVERLKREATRDRLAQLSTEQLQQLVAAFERLQTRYMRTVTPELVATLRGLL